MTKKSKGTKSTKQPKNANRNSANANRNPASTNRNSANVKSNSRNSSDRKSSNRKHSRIAEVRLIAGDYRGTKLKFPANLCHPMSERARQAIFNILAEDVNFEGCKVLDLFCGSGAIGLEAMSRGAEEIHFVDKSRPLIDALTANIRRIDPYYSITRILCRYVTAVQYCQDFLNGKTDGFLPHRRFDLIFADPPYDDLQLDFLPYISQILHVDGFFVLSIPADQKPPLIPGLHRLKDRTYAGCRLCFYERTDRAEPNDNVTYGYDEDDDDLPDDFPIDFDFFPFSY